MTNVKVQVESDNITNWQGVDDMDGHITLSEVLRLGMQENYDPPASQPASDYLNNAHCADYATLADFHGGPDNAEMENAGDTIHVQDKSALSNDLRGFESFEFRTALERENFVVECVTGKHITACVWNEEATEDPEPVFQLIVVPSEEGLRTLPTILRRHNGRVAEA